MKNAAFSVALSICILALPLVGFAEEDEAAVAQEHHERLVDQAKERLIAARREKDKEEIKAANQEISELRRVEKDGLILQRYRQIVQQKEMEKVLEKEREKSIAEAKEKLRMGDRSWEGWTYEPRDEASEIEKAASLYADLMKFRNDRAFKAYGFGQGGPYRKWLPAVDALQFTREQNDGYLRDYDALPAELRQLGVRYALQSDDKYLNDVIPRLNRLFAGEVWNKQDKQD